MGGFLFRLGNVYRGKVLVFQVRARDLPLLRMEYEAVIGLETHVQLKTKSKMWCGCANEFGALPNTNVCPICLGLPGVLPVANEEGLKLTVLTGLLLNCEIPRFAKFDRKNYFYPD